MVVTALSHHGQKSGNRVPCRVVRLTFPACVFGDCGFDQSQHRVPNLVQRISVRRRPSLWAAVQFVSPPETFVTC